MAQKSKDTYSGLRKAADIALQERNRYRSLYELLLKDYNALKEKYESMSEDIDQICEAKIQAAITPIIKERDEARSELLKAVDKNVNLQAQLNDLTKICDDLTRAVDNATIALQMTKIKKFITSSEQARILNNRGANRDKRGEEKDNFDGTPESVQSGEGGNNPPAEPGEGDTQQETQSGEAKEQPQKKKKSKGRRPALEPYLSVDVVRHPLSEYFELPEGGKFKTRGGEIEIHERIWYEYIPGRFVKHIYETATYEDAVGDCKNTLPEDALDTPVKGCPFGVEMLVFILVEKYAYHNSKNNIRRKLKEMGASFAKSTFVHYYQLAEKLLVDMFGSVFKGAVLETIYLMIDETCELVGVDDKETGLTKYLKKYLWGFYNKERGLVQYLYDKGSRSTAVLVSYLTGFMGSFTSDGYVAYKYFDGEACPEVVHLGCNTHSRRLYVEALPCATEICYSFIDDYEEVFHNETLFKGMDPEARQKQRQKHTLPIFVRMLSRAQTISKNDELMAIPLLKKAINYFLNQYDNLIGFIFDGNAECSNNLMEQRFKTIKLDLKNCQIIGSEGAAENAAFMHSLVESCRLNNLNPTEYLTMLLRQLGKDLDKLDKEELRGLLPDKWRPNC